MISSQSSTQELDNEDAEATDDEYYDFFSEDIKTTKSSPANKKRNSTTISSGHNNNISSTTPIDVDYESLPNYEQWSDKYAPRTMNELCMSKERISQVENFFQQFVLQNMMIAQDVLIVAGPPGSGKTSLIRAVCASLKLGIKEFSHVDLEQNIFNEWRDERPTNGLFVSYESRLKTFDRFLQSSRFCALPGMGTSIDGNVSVHLIGELPITADNNYRMKKELFEILKMNCLSSNRRRNPIVIVHHIYESPTVLSNLNRSFPKELLNAPNVQVVQVKGFGKRDMKTVLTRILSNEKKIKTNTNGYDFRSLGHTTCIDDIIEKSDGDLRHAINQLQFMSIRQLKEGKISIKEEAKKLIKQKFSDFQFPEAPGGGEGGNISNKVLTTKSTSEGYALVKSRKALLKDLEDEDIRDPIIDIHHAAGRVLYGKRKPNGRLEFDLEHNVLHSVHANENALVSYVHHNMPNFCNSIEDISSILDDYSYGDTFCHSRFFESNGGSNYNRARVNADYQGEALSIYSFLISCYSTLHHNQLHRAKNEWKQICAPKINKVFFESRDLKEELIQNFMSETNSTCQRSLTQDIVPYQHLIYHTCQNRRDVINDVRIISLTPELRRIRWHYFKEHFTPQQFKLLQKIHVYRFRGTHSHLGLTTSAPAGSDDHEAYDVSLNEGEDLSSTAQSTVQGSNSSSGTAIAVQENHDIFEVDDISSFDDS